MREFLLDEAEAVGATYNWNSYPLWLVASKRTSNHLPRLVFTLLCNHLSMDGFVDSLRMTRM